MNNRVSISTEYLNRLERRMKTLEDAVLQLATTLEKSQASDVFYQLYTSKKFEEHLKKTLELLKKDRDLFVDPFATYRKQ